MEREAPSIMGRLLRRIRGAPTTLEQPPPPEPPELIADTLFDFPGGSRPGMWDFICATIEEGKVVERTALVARDEPEDLSTRYAFRYSPKDERCQVGRDYLHPGYLQVPLLRWVAHKDGLYRFEGELLHLTPSAPCSIGVLLFCDDLRFDSFEVNPPSTATFEYALWMRAGQRFELAFQVGERIDHQNLYYGIRLYREPCDIESAPEPATLPYGAVASMKWQVRPSAAWMQWSESEVDRLKMLLDSEGASLRDPFPTWEEMAAELDYSTLESLVVGRQFGMPGFFRFKE